MDEFQGFVTMAQKISQNAPQDGSNEKTVRLDTRSGPVAAALNLDFLDVPDDLGLTVPAPPMLSMLPPPPPPLLPRLAAPVGPDPFPAEGASMTMTGATGHVVKSAPEGRDRLMRLGLLFAGSFVLVGGGVFLLNSMEQGEKSTPEAESGASVQEPSLIAGMINTAMQSLGLAEEAVAPLPEAAKKKSSKDAKNDSGAVAKATTPASSVVGSGESVVAGLEAEGNVDVDVGDPYRIIANELDQEALKALNHGRRNMSATEEEGWKAALIHKFPFQHYRAVDEMRAFRASGSEAILRTALEDRRLWVRMNAALGLVESGIPLMASEVEKAVGKNERRDLLNGYFQRFTRSSNMAERYVLKFALPLVPDAARVEILQALVNAGDPDLELFVIAGSFDASRRVQRWATQWLARHPAALLRMDEYRGALEEFGLTESLRSGVALARAGDVARGDAREGDGGNLQQARRQHRRAFADRPVAGPGVAGFSKAGAAADAGVATGSAGAGQGTSVEFYRRDPQ